MCFAACICRYTMPSGFVTLLIVITMGYFYLVREISMGNRWCTQPRTIILSFVIGIYHDRGSVYTLTTRCSSCSPLLIISPFRGVRSLFITIILYYRRRCILRFYTFATRRARLRTNTSTDLCRSSAYPWTKIPLADSRQCPPSELFNRHVVSSMIIIYYIVHTHESIGHCSVSEKRH